MKPSPAGTARELEPQAPARGEPRAAESEGRWREKGEADTERQRTRERQEATLAGLAELEYLRQRQELLVRGALRGAGAAVSRTGELPGEATQRSRLEEKFLEENILLLRKQLVGCARRWEHSCPFQGAGGRAGDLGWARGRSWQGEFRVSRDPPPRASSGAHGAWALCQVRGWRLRAGCGVRVASRPLCLRDSRVGGVVAFSCSFKMPFNWEVFVAAGPLGPRADKS